MQLDIFYKELSYDTIEQQKAFKFESLLGEVGGFLGLLLGKVQLMYTIVLSYSISIYPFTPFLFILEITFCKFFRYLLLLPANEIGRS